MDDRNRKNSGYNWTYSGEDAGDYRAKYTQGFDPNYLRHTEERKQQEEENLRRQRAAKRKPVSRRRASLFRQQSIEVNEPEPVPEESTPEVSEERQKTADTRRRQGTGKGVRKSTGQSGRTRSRRSMRSGSGSRRSGVKMTPIQRGV